MNFVATQDAVSISLHRGYWRKPAKFLRSLRQWPIASPAVGWRYQASYWTFALNAECLQNKTQTAWKKKQDAAPVFVLHIWCRRISLHHQPHVFCLPSPTPKHGSDSANGGWNRDRGEVREGATNAMPCADQRGVWQRYVCNTQMYHFFFFLLYHCL